MLSGCAEGDDSDSAAPGSGSENAYASEATDGAELGDAADLFRVTGSWTATQREEYCAQGLQEAARYWESDDALATYGVQVGYLQAYNFTRDACFTDTDGDGVGDDEDEYPKDADFSGSELYKVRCSGAGQFFIDRANPNWAEVWSEPFPRSTYCGGPRITSPLGKVENRVYDASPDRDTLGIAYQQCVEHDTDWTRNQWPLSVPQAKEAQRALMLCPQHPQAAAIRGRIAQANQEQQLRDEGRVFDNGLYRVGRQIQPGTYFTTDVEDCYWERLNSAGALIDNYFGTALRVEVLISASDFSFRSDRCGTWRPVS